MSKKKLIIFSIFCFLFFSFMRYFQTFITSENISDVKLYLAEINGNIQGYCSIRNVGFIYTILVFLGFDYLNYENTNIIVKSKKRLNYLNKYLLKKVIVVSFIVSFIHGIVNVIYNFYLSKVDILINEMFIIKSIAAAIILGIFYIVFLLMYIILKVFFRKNISTLAMVLLLSIFYYLDYIKIFNFLPHRYISNWGVFLVNENWITIFILYTFTMISYLVITYYVLTKVYKKKEFY
ncbi:MAG: WxPxxD family membrane protein [Clostridium sp.]